MTPRAGLAVLAHGGPALDAVIASVSVLEDEGHLFLRYLLRTGDPKAVKEQPFTAEELAAHALLEKAKLWLEDLPGRAVDELTIDDERRRAAHAALLVPRPASSSASGSTRPHRPRRPASWPRVSPSPLRTRSCG